MRRLFPIVIFAAGCTQLLPTTPSGPLPTHHTDSGVPLHDAGTDDAGTDPMTHDAGAPEGAPCDVTRDCQSNLSCPASSHVCEACVPGEACGDGGVCFAAVYGPNSPRSCGYGGNKAPCFGDQGCQTDYTCVSSGDRGGTWTWCRCTGPSCPECLDEGQYCDGGLCHTDGGALSCSPGQNNEHCRTSDDCVAGGTCFSQVSASGAKQICTDGQTGSPCAESTQCDSGVCTSMVTAGGVINSCD